MPQTLILAKNISEANAYARFIGLPRFSYRAVRDAGAIRGIRNARVIRLSSFAKRPDRHAINAALRHAKTLQVEDVDLAELREQGFGVAKTRDTFVDLRPPMSDDVLAEAYAYHAIRPHLEAPGWEPGPDMLETMASSTAIPLDPEPQAVVGGGMRLSDDEVAALAGEDNREPTGEAEPSEEPAPIAKPGGRTRRRRCPECADLLAPEDFDAHLDTHAKPAPAANFFGGE